MAKTRTQAVAQYIEQRVVRGDRSMASWHLLLRRVTFGSALALMFASYVSLHWALDLVTGNALIAYGVPLFLETGMASVASTATTIRKKRPDGTRGGYYISLWLIFSFVMALAQAANIGHAMVVVEPQIGQLPSFIPTTVIYVFAGTFAALFPLGGTMFVHVSGFLREHSVDAQWIDADADTVMVANPGARTEALPTVRAEPVTRTQPPAAVRAPHPTPTTVPVRTHEPVRAQDPARTHPTPPPEPPVTHTTVDLTKATQPTPEAPIATQQPVPQAAAEAPPFVDETDMLAYETYAKELREIGREMKGTEIGGLLGGLSESQGNRRRAGWRTRFDIEHPSVRDAIRQGRYAPIDPMADAAAHDREDAQRGA